MKFSFDLRKVNHHHGLLCACQEKVQDQITQLTTHKVRLNSKFELLQKHLLDSLFRSEEF